MTIKTKEDFKGKYLKLANISDEYFNKTVKEDIFFKIIEKCWKLDKKSKGNFLGTFHKRDDWVSFFDNPYIYIHSKNGYISNHIRIEENRDLQEISIKQFLEE